MRELIKEGFLRDLLVVIALTVVLGAAVTTGIAYAVNTYLAQQVTGLLGDLGDTTLSFMCVKNQRTPQRLRFRKSSPRASKGIRERRPGRVREEQFLCCPSGQASE